MEKLRFWILGHVKTRLFTIKAFQNVGVGPFFSNKWEPHIAAVGLLAGNVVVVVLDRGAGFQKPRKKTCGFFNRGEICSFLFAVVVVVVVGDVVGVVCCCCCCCCC